MCRRTVTRWTPGSPMLIAGAVVVAVLIAAFVLIAMVPGSPVGSAPDYGPVD